MLVSVLFCEGLMMVLGLSCRMKKSNQCLKTLTANTVQPIHKVLTPSCYLKAKFKRIMAKLPNCEGE